MKKLILFACFLIFALLGYGQNSFKYPLIIGTNNGTGGYVRLNGATSGSSTIRVNPNAGTGTIFELPFNNGTNNYVLITNGSGVTSWYDPNNYGFRTAIQVGQQFKDSIANGVDLASVAVLKTEFNRVTDSLNNVIDGLNSEIENIWNAIDSIGNYDRRAPAFASAEIGSFADDTLIVLLNATDVHQDSVPPVSAFSLNAGSNEHGIASVDIGRDTIYLALDSAAVYGTVYSLDYTRGTPALQDSTGNKTASWTGKSVTNNMPEPEAGVPTFLTNDGYTWSWIIADADSLTLSGSKITAIDAGDHDWVGGGTPGIQWDADNEEIDLAYNSDGSLALSASPADVPITVYIVIRINGDTSDGSLFFFSVPNTRINIGSEENMMLYAGAWNLFADRVDDSYGVITCVLNGSSSSIQWNNMTAATGSPGSNGVDDIYIGYYLENVNSSIKEVIVRNNAESAQNIAAVKAYLYSKYSITP